MGNLIGHFINSLISGFEGAGGPYLCFTSALYGRVAFKCWPCLRHVMVACQAINSPQLQQNASWHHRDRTLEDCGFLGHNQCMDGCRTEKPGMGTRTGLGELTRDYMPFKLAFNPFNAEATFVQSTRVQIFLITIWTSSCWYSLDRSPWVLSDEYPCARVSVKFQFFCIIL